MSDLRVGSIIQKAEGAPVSYTVMSIEDGKVMVSINSNRLIHAEPPFLWEGDYHKLADFYGDPGEIKVGK